MASGEGDAAGCGIDGDSRGRDLNGRDGKHHAAGDRLGDHPVIARERAAIALDELERRRAAVAGANYLVERRRLGSGRRGGIVGAVALIGLPEIFRWAADYRMLIYGLVLLLLVRFRPQGLLGTV